MYCKTQVKTAVKYLQIVNNKNCKKNTIQLYEIIKIIHDN